MSLLYHFFILSLCPTNDYIRTIKINKAALNDKNNEILNYKIKSHSIPGCSLSVLLLEPGFRLLYLHRFSIVCVSARIIIIIICQITLYLKSLRLLSALHSFISPRTILPLSRPPSDLVIAVMDKDRPGSRKNKLRVNPWIRVV